MRLGIDDYGLRHQHWDPITLTQRCIELGATNLMFSVDNIPVHDVTTYSHMRKIAEDAGMTIEAAGMNWNPHGDSQRLATPAEQDEVRDRVRSWIEIAGCIGAKVLRGVMSAGNLTRDAAVPLGIQIEDTAGLLRDMLPEARKQGIDFLAPEIHWDLTAREMLLLLEKVGDDHVGVTYDSGNPFCMLEDPVEAAELLKDRIVSSHIRDSAVKRTMDGVVVQWTVMGIGSARLAEIRDIIDSTNPQCAWNIEIILDNGPESLPFLQQEFWTPGWSSMPASQLSRFLQLVEKGGTWPAEAEDYCIHPARGGDATPESLAAQEWQGNIRSWQYSRDVLGIPDRAALDMLESDD